MPKKLKYQYSVSVSSLAKSVKKQANVKIWGELKFLLKTLASKYESFNEYYYEKQSLKPR